MAYWLLKSEPSVYSFEDLARDKKTTWDGVTNNAALMYLRQMQKGDEAVIYHTGDERQAVGLAKVISAPFADPKEDDPKLAVVDLSKGVKLSNPVTLATFKAHPLFKGSPLVRQGRLSVVPLEASQWKALLALSKKAG